MAAAITADDIFGPALDDDEQIAGTDALLAAAFARDHTDRLRWDVRLGAWRVCSAAGIWTPDATLAAPRLFQQWTEQQAMAAVALATTKKDIAAVRSAVARTLSAPKQRQILELARHQEVLADAGTSWDADAMVLATTTGQLIDLRTGGIRPVQPADKITLTTAVAIDPAARCDRWRRFITEIADDNASIADLLHKAAGYTATGDITEQVFLCNLGAGSNGKSLLSETLAYVLGGYAGLLPFSTLTRDRDGRAIQAEIADLPGTRFVRASEIREGAYLDEGRIKALTGGDPINVARKYGHPFTFRPEFKLWLNVNHKPRVADRSHGFWRRAVLVPFTRTFTGDKSLERILRDEAPGILAWLVEGALAWQAHGLPRPAAAEQARQDWRDGEDTIAQWADLALVAEPEGRVGAAEVFKAFTAWATGEGMGDRERPGRRSFGEWMGTHYRAEKTKAGKFYLDVVLVPVTGDGCDGSSGETPPTRARETTFPSRHHHSSPVTSVEDEFNPGRAFLDPDEVR